jgi:hypothetical protein
LVVAARLACRAYVGAGPLLRASQIRALELGSSASLLLQRGGPLRRAVVRARGSRIARPIVNEEPWWSVTRETAWYKLNVVGAVALGIFLFGWRDAGYPWLARQDQLPLLFAVVLASLVGAVPLIVWLRRTDHDVLAVWTIFATVLVVIAAARAAGDAQDRLYHDCWTLSKEKDGSEMMACAPGNNEPRQWLSSEDDPGRSCDPIDEVDYESTRIEGDPVLDSGTTGATIWVCE